MTLLAFAAERRRLQQILINCWHTAPAPTAVDQYLLLSGHSAANRRAPLLLSIDETDRQMDGHATVT